MRATAKKPYMVQYCSAVNMKNRNQKKLPAQHKGSVYTPQNGSVHVGDVTSQRWCKACERGWACSAHLR